MAEQCEETSSVVKRDGKRRGSEEEIYTLLFQEVDNDGSGLVGVASLVEYLEKMQLGSSEGHSSEDVYDSHQDVHQIKYNLQLLKAMLEEVSGDTKVVDETTYSRVIRLWVKDVRDRSNQQHSLEVSQLSSESEDSDDGVSMTTPRSHISFEADESFETSGGNSSTHSGFDMLASLEDVRLENRRLLEKEKQLQASLDTAEEQLRGVQSENSSLLSQLKGVQQQKLKIEVLERQNSATEQSLKNEEMKCQQLTEDVQHMSEQLTEAEHEIIVLREQIKDNEEERDRDIRQTDDYQQQLLVKEEMLCAEKIKYYNLKEQLNSLMNEEHTLRSKVIELEKNNKLLERENEELNSVTIPTTGPSYSTPFRSTELPSLHEEISRHGNLSGQAVLSPLVGVDNHHGNKESCRLEDHYDNEPSISRSHGNLTLEDLEHIAQNSSNKFHSKTEVIVKVLSELMPPLSSPPPHHHSHSSTDSITEVHHDKRLRDNSNLKQLVACVQKLYSEKKSLKQQVAKLQDELKQKVTEDVDAGVQTVATPIPQETTPLHPPVINIARTGSDGCIGRVTRGVVWSLYLIVMVTLLLATLVWLHEHLAPCCHGNLTPGGMIWSMIEPHITVKHHGYI